MNTWHAGWPSALAVVVPAHNEAAELPAALGSLRRAADHPQLVGLPLALVVVADACDDATAAVATAWGASVVDIRSRNVGAARAAGVARALEVLGTAGERAWIVTTDADTLVPPRWLAHHLHHARQGWHGVVGTVRLRRGLELSARAVARAQARYLAGRPVPPLPWGHPHVHGANLGVGAVPYQAAGGFPALTHGEDRALVAALDRLGHQVLRTDACPVRTSGRLDPRAPHGFGAALRCLLEEPAGTSESPPWSGAPRA
ncbi:glycosyltransferase [Streptomyces sp. VTCC 41912]|uniref:glycosyltransferase n=1 Tax=Streptomyces sp. VTCC 41912 TaxID=3383243 RepID=UPI003896CBFD